VKPIHPRGVARGRINILSQEKFRDAGATIETSAGKGLGQRRRLMLKISFLIPLDDERFRLLERRLVLEKRFEAREVASLKPLYGISEQLLVFVSVRSHGRSLLLVIGWLTIG